MHNHICIEIFTLYITIVINAVVVTDVEKQPATMTKPIIWQDPISKQTTRNNGGILDINNYRISFEIRFESIETRKKYKCNTKKHPNILKIQTCSPIKKNDKPVYYEDDFKTFDVNNKIYLSSWYRRDDKKTILFLIGPKESNKKHPLVEYLYEHMKDAIRFIVTLKTKRKGVCRTIILKSEPKKLIWSLERVYFIDVELIDNQRKTFFKTTRGIVNNAYVSE
ncbi:hypothetical protein CDIK_3434 [Cucumispora dikerogammari]|nr:hypothetical protein CDIK_3434 [Cucumispora dikerogammari]